ncbi:hypothetical protein RchiOBHm_Chr2g0120391 [Rosa chinensis]|uniref:Uncharacterized protein n=1 Tax=Rosa chinensis TaxID=74649 RepID=A0A2P6RSD0_ROSCH|nr:hypothetical protein RchiOBHm_Chr2g0120391 [Rosa chinensis]
MEKHIKTLIVLSHYLEVQSFSSPLSTILSKLKSQDSTTPKRFLFWQGQIIGVHAALHLFKVDRTYLMTSIVVTLHF